MDIELAAVHEAGHAVMQWLVGWELKELHMTVKEGFAIDPASECPYPSLESKSAVRKRLLVLFSGNDATRERWPKSENNQQDWLHALGAIHAHCQRSGAASWVPTDGYALRDAVEDSISKPPDRHCRLVRYRPHSSRSRLLVLCFLRLEVPHRPIAVHSFYTVQHPLNLNLIPFGPASCRVTV